MKNFSDKTKKMRRKATVKVALQRYLFFILLPIFLYVCYVVGKFVTHIITTYLPLINETLNIVKGVMVLVFAILFIILLMIYLGEIISKFVKCVREGSLLTNLKRCINSIGKTVSKFWKFILKLPSKIHQALKKERENFKDAVDEQIVIDSQNKKTDE